jgi:hypothetical protein
MVVDFLLRLAATYYPIQEADEVLFSIQCSADWGPKLKNVYEHKVETRGYRKLLGASSEVQVLPSIR